MSHNYTKGTISSDSKTAILPYISHAHTLSHFGRYLTLCNPMDCSPPGSVHGVLQPRILEWVAMPFSRSLLNRGIKLMSLISPALARGFFTTSATWEAHTSHTYTWKTKRIIKNSQTTFNNHIVLGNIGFVVLRLSCEQCGAKQILICNYALSLGTTIFSVRKGDRDAPWMRWDQNPCSSKRESKVWRWTHYLVSYLKDNWFRQNLPLESPRNSNYSVAMSTAKALILVLNITPILEEPKALGGMNSIENG